MNRTRPVLLVVMITGLVAFLATACSGDTIVNSSTTTIAGINVNGSGRAFGTPDIVFLQLGVNLERPSVAQARQDAAGAMEAVIQALQSNGVDEDDIQTSQFSIHPQYDFNGRTQTIIGYGVTNVVTAKLTDIESAGQVIDAAAAAGGDAVVVQSISFAIDDPRELQAQARADAMAQARARAGELADHGNVDLGRLLSITEGYQTVQPFAADARLALAQEAATPIMSGELEVVINVNVLYAIE